MLVFSCRTVSFGSARYTDGANVGQPPFHLMDPTGGNNEYNEE